LSLADGDQNLVTTRLQFKGNVGNQTYDETRQEWKASGGSAWKPSTGSQMEALEGLFLESLRSRGPSKVADPRVLTACARIAHRQPKLGNVHVH